MISFQKIDRPGVYDLPIDVYHGDCCAGTSLSASGAITIIEFCPAKFYAESYMGGRQNNETSRAREIGQATHTLILEPSAWEERLVVIEADSYRSKAARASRDAALESGKIPLLAGEAESIQAMAEAIWRHPLAGPALTGGLSERSFIWPDGDIWLKARPDYWIDSRRQLIELKTVPNARPDALERHAFDRGFYLQAAFHGLGIKAVTGSLPREFWIVAQEREPPYLITVGRLSSDGLEWGMKAAHKAIETFQLCVASGEWPGYRDPGRQQDHPFDLMLPGYAAYKIQEREERGEFQSQAQIRRSAAEFNRFYRPLEEEDA